MLATKQFQLRITPERKKMLEFLAKQDGRSKAKLIDRLILERYEQVAKPGGNTETRRDQFPHAQPT